MSNLDRLAEIARVLREEGDDIAGERAAEGLLSDVAPELIAVVKAASEVEAHSHQLPSSLYAEHGYPDLYRQRRTAALDALDRKLSEVLDA